MPVTHHCRCYKSIGCTHRMKYEHVTLEFNLRTVPDSKKCIFSGGKKVYFCLNWWWCLLLVPVTHHCRCSKGIGCTHRMKYDWVTLEFNIYIIPDSKKCIFLGEQKVYFCLNRWWCLFLVTPAHHYWCYKSIGCTHMMKYDPVTLEWFYEVCIWFYEVVETLYHAVPTHVTAM